MSVYSSDTKWTRRSVRRRRRRSSSSDIGSSNDDTRRVIATATLYQQPKTRKETART